MAEAYLLEKLQSVEQTYKELTRRLADPDIVTNPDELQRVTKARSSLEETVETYDTWKKLRTTSLGQDKFSKRLATTQK